MVWIAFTKCFYKRCYVSLDSFELLTITNKHRVFERNKYFPNTRILAAAHTASELKVIRLKFIKIRRNGVETAFFPHGFAQLDVHTAVSEIGHDRDASFFARLLDNAVDVPQCQRRDLPNFALGGWNSCP